MATNLDCTCVVEQLVFGHSPTSGEISFWCVARDVRFLAWSVTRRGREEPATRLMGGHTDTWLHTHTPTHTAYTMYTLYTPTLYTNTHLICTEIPTPPHCHCRLQTYTFIFQQIQTDTEQKYTNKFHLHCTRSAVRGDGTNSLKNVDH